MSRRATRRAQPRKASSARRRTLAACRHYLLLMSRRPTRRALSCRWKTAPSLEHTKPPPRPVLLSPGARTVSVEPSDVERILARASVAVAPYPPAEATYTRFADPGKLKAYLAAGLPIVLTDVPPNARELEREAGAEIVPYDAAAIAAAIERALASPENWRRRHEAALAYAKRFDWDVLLADALARLEINVP